MAEKKIMIKEWKGCEDVTNNAETEVNIGNMKQIMLKKIMYEWVE